MNRREFAMGMLCGAGALAMGGCRGICGRTSGIKLAMAGYTLYDFDTDGALAQCEKFGVHYLCVKDKHLPFDATPAQVVQFRRKCEDHGVTPWCGGACRGVQGLS